MIWERSMLNDDPLGRVILTHHWNSDDTDAAVR
jgi:hypothetical protein